LNIEEFRGERCGCSFEPQVQTHLAEPAAVLPIGIMSKVYSRFIFVIGVTGNYVVAGGIGYTGTYIVRRLLAERDIKITVLTNHPNRKHEFGTRIRVEPYNFDNPAKLRETLRGAKCVINTYWSKPIKVTKVRLNYHASSFTDAVKNSKLLVDACVEAGVKRLVHISVSNPSRDYDYEYFGGKLEVEDYIRDSGLSYAILRPTLVFGDEDMDLNNITSLIRKYPFFLIFGDGKYKVTPVFVDDVAREVVSQSCLMENITEDAVGPETYEFEELVKLIAGSVGKQLRIFHVNKAFIPLVCWGLSLVHGDKVVTPQEMHVLMDGLMHSISNPIGETRFSEWLETRNQTFGTEYHSEVERHFSD